jgi:hypothetical protein
MINCLWIFLVKKEIKYRRLTIPSVVLNQYYVIFLVSEIQYFIN